MTPIEAVPRRAWWVLAVVSVCVAPNPLSQSILNVGFPKLRDAFSATPVANLSWVISGFSITSAATLIIGAVAAARYGAKRVLVFGTIASSLTLLVCGFAPNVETLLAARLVHGAVSATLIPTSATLVLREFPPSRSGTAIAAWAGAGFVSTAIGPTLGALLVSAWGWRWVFWINVPVGLIGVALLVWLVPETVRAESRFPDLWSIPLTIVATSGVILSISQSSRWGWSDRKTIASLLIGLLFGVALVARSLRHPRPLLDLSLFRYRSSRVANLSTLLYGTPFFAMFFAFPRFTQEVWKLDIRDAGLLFLPIPVAGALLANPVGRFADARGQRTVMLVGSLFQIAGGLVAVFGIGDERNIGTYLVSLTFMGLAASLAWPAIYGNTVLDVPASSVGAATSVNQIAQRIATASGVALAVALIGEDPGAGVGRYERVFVLVTLGGVVGVLMSRAMQSTRKPIVRRE